MSTRNAVQIRPVQASDVERTWNTNVVKVVIDQWIENDMF